MPKPKFIVNIRSSGNTRFALGFLLLFVFHPAGAANWENGYGASLTVGYDDNFRLEPEDELDTAISNLGVFANSRRTTETSSVDLAIGADGSRYSESSIDGNTAYNLSVNSEKRGERATGSLNIGYRSELITTTELLDTGFVDEDGNRDTVSVSPGASYQVDERNTVFGNLNFADVSYDTDSLTDYQNNSLSLGWQHQLDETSSVSIGGVSTRYESDDDEETDTNTLYVGYQWRSEITTTYNARIGYTEVDSSGETDRSSAYTFNANHVVDDRNRFNLSASHIYEPSGTGNVRETTRLGIRWEHALSGESQVTLSVDGLSTDERDYYAIAAGYNYQYTREINLGASYRYREQDEDNISSARSNYLSFSISYSPE